MRPWRLTFIVVLVVSCSTTVDPVPTTSAPVTSTTTAASTTTTPSSSTTTTTTPAAATTTTVDPFARPDWLGTRKLPLRRDGLGEVQPTPPELMDRRLETIDLLDPPASNAYESSIDRIPDDVLARSTWSEECPVAVDELRYLTMTHHGFDGVAHTGEMIVNASVADDVVEVFGRLYEDRFPIEQMRVTGIEELDDHPTGDANDTGSFVCRPAVGSTNWSYHAYGLAIDINPFHNPYVRDDLVIPELASAYVDRDNERVGMVYDGDVVTTAFADIGWEWGGNWTSPKDWMHFSQTGG